MAAVGVGVRAVAVIVVIGQGCLAFSIFVMGLGWGGMFWVAAVVQAVILVFVAVVATAVRPGIVPLVPVVSLVLLAGLWAADRTVDARFCSPAARAAVEQLGPLPGASDGELYYMVEFGRGCVARFNSPLPQPQVIEHYRVAGQRNGWQQTGVNTPVRAQVSNTRWTVAVHVNTDEYGMYALTVSRR